MGKKNRKNLREAKEEKLFRNSANSMEEAFDYMLINQGPKSRSKKLSKKHRNKLLKEEARERAKDKYNTSNSVLKEYVAFQKVSVFAKDKDQIDKNFLISSIKNYVDIPFTPLGYFKGEEEISFYFDSVSDTARSIQSLNKRIQSPSGELMKITVCPAGQMDFILNCFQVDLLKSIMSRRYNSSSELLDLSQFHMDPQLLENETFAPLSNSLILKQVFKIIKECVPKISALDLSNNKLENQLFKMIDTITDSCRSLSALNLENNKIKDLKYLKYLRPFPLKELKLVGNVVCNNFKSKSTKYFKSVRKELPFLKVIDGQELSGISFEESLNLLKPSVLNEHVSNSPIVNARLAASASANPVTEEKLKTFLEQYYSMVDTPEKESLLQAYLSTAKIELKSLNPLIPSRAFEGQPQIQEFLQSWPATTHNHSSFDLQIINLSAEEGIAQIKGVCLFCESQLQLEFKRTMKIIPYNSGFCCSADLLEIA